MAISYNGWPASQIAAALNLVTIEPVRGRRFTVQARVAPIFDHFIRWYHENIEPIDTGILDDWSYSYRQNRNSNNLSCHSSGTAVDLNAVRHPNGVRGTMSAANTAKINAQLAFYEGVLTWGNPGTVYGWQVGSNPDLMHYEIGVKPTDARIDRVLAKIGAVVAAPLAPLPIDWAALQMIVARQIVDAQIAQQRKKVVEDGMLIYIPTGGDGVGRYPILYSGGLNVVGLDATELDLHQKAGLPTLQVSNKLWQLVVDNAQHVINPQDDAVA